MEKRAFLAVILSIAVLVLWQVFFTPKQKPEKGTPPPAAEEPAQPSTQPQTEGTEPSAPTATAPSPTATAPAPPAPTVPLAASQKAREIVVETPLYHAVFTETGARLRDFTLKRYRETIDKNSPAKDLVMVEKIEHLPLSFNFQNHSVAALSLAPYVADKTSVVLNEGDANKRLRFSYEAPGWLRISREYLFSADSYRIEMKVTVTNLGSQPLRNSPTLSLFNVPFSSAGEKSRYNFEGPLLLKGGELQEVDVEDIEGEKLISGPINWFAYTNQYFIMAVVPGNLTPNHAQLEVLDPSNQLVESTFVGPEILVQPGAEKEFHFTLYSGPKEVNTLKTADPTLAKAVNFGWFDIIAQPLLVCLKFFNRFTHNYGLAIILLTVVIKLLFWPLTHKSYASMQAMKKLQPKMKQIREKYKDDKEKMNQEIMQLYRTHKVNPLGGCLPMVLQIPVFFALYRVLYSSIAMRHAHFLWWINDLSAPDRLSVGIQIPFLGGLPVLTLLMGLSMFVQQKMTPTAGDPRQEKMMLMLPVVFTVFFVNFPSGLVLYWLVNNILSIGQQFYINKKSERT